MFAHVVAERDRIRGIKREAVLPHMQGIDPLTDLVLEYEDRYPVGAVKQAADVDEESKESEDKQQ